MQYRPEIDGLRTLAVLPVIFFHAGLFGLSGGYVGVDIFFVISGYLITSIIISELNKNQFSIINFYERRARRILPALSAVLIFTILLALILMPAASFKSYSESLLATITISSNIFFYFDSGYFSTASNEKPLLHTWSLAVEEQYYLFFPLLISAFWFLGRKKISTLIFILSLLSLSASHYLLAKQEVNANFYLIFSRAWELFFGSLIALIGMCEMKQKKCVKEIFSFLGLGMIIYAIVFFNEQTPFPSGYTFVPVIGTMLIIIFAGSETATGKFLANKIFVSIGLISYSLYLWHQPLFAFIRMKTIGEPDEYIFIIAVILAFLLSFFSYRYIETPFRKKSQFSKKRIFQLSAVSIVMFILVGGAGHLFNGFESRFRVNPYLKTMQFSPKRNQCHTSGLNYLRPESACKYFGSEITWAVFGDSHIVEPAFALAKLLEPKNQGVLQLSFSGCPPALLFEVKLPGCSSWIKESLAFLEQNNNIQNVLVGFRYSKFLHGDQLTSYPHIPNKSPVLEFSSEEMTGVLNGDASREVYWQSLAEIVHRLLAAGKTVYLLYPIPELPVHIVKASSPFSIFEESAIIDMERTTSANYYFSRNAFILRKLDSLPYSNKLYAIKPFEILCSTEYCPAAVLGTSLYFDDSHLSVEGSSILLRSSAIVENLKL